MPPVSEAQRRLMHGAANTKGGMGGVSQAVGKEFADADQPGPLPETAADRAPRASKMYSKKKATKRGG